MTATPPPAHEQPREHSRELRAALAEELSAAVELRHRLHADPEPSGAERRTAERVAQAIGLGDIEPVAETGLLIRVGPATGPCVAVRAELDALPVHERTGAADSASNGRMHACGHDVHLAAVTALARAAHRAERPLLAILQPREEGPPSGARDIVGAGALPRQQVRAVVGAHVQPLLRRGQVAATSGAVNAATDEIRVVVTGRGGHGGYPHLTRDPIAALAQVVVALQQVVSRQVDPIHAAVLTIGQIHAGTAANIIPDQAHAVGTLRVLDEADHDQVRREVAAIVEHVAAAFGCRGEVTFCEGEPALVNDPGLAACTQAWLGRLGMEHAGPLRSCGADDFSYYGAVAPSLMMFVGVDQPAGATLHQPTFRPPDEAVGDVALALLAGYLGALELGT